MQPIARVIPAAIAGMLRSAPLSRGKVEFAWKFTVGPAIERVSSVRLEGGTLIVDVPSAQWAREIRRSSAMILPRLQVLLGADAVKSISVRN